MSAGEAVMGNGWKDEKEFFDVNRNRLKIIHTSWQSGHFRWNKGCGKIPDHHSSSWLSPPEGIKSSQIYVCVMNKKILTGCNEHLSFFEYWVHKIHFKSLRWKLATPIRKEINGLTGKSISLHSWSLSLGLWVWTHYLTVSSVQIHSIAADGHTHSVLTITQPSKIAALIVFCSTTKLYRRKTDRIMQLLHHPRFTKNKDTFIFLKPSTTGPFTLNSHSGGDDHKRPCMSRVLIGCLRAAVADSCHTFWIFSERLKFNSQLLPRRLLVVPST